MIKKGLIFCILLLAFNWSYSGIDQNLMGKIDERVIEMKSELKKELHKKQYGNQVVGSFELRGENIVLEAKMIPLEGRPRQYGFKVTEVRELNDFDKIKSSNAFLPKYGINHKTNIPFNMAKILGGIMALLLALLFLKKIFREKEEEIVEIYEEENTEKNTEEKNAA